MRARGRERVEHRSGGMSGSFKGGIGESVTNVKKSEKKCLVFIPILIVLFNKDLPLMCTVSRRIAPHPHLYFTAQLRCQ